MYVTGFTIVNQWAYLIETKKAAPLPVREKTSEGTGLRICLEDFEPVAPATQRLGDDATVQEPVADDALPEGFVQEELDLDLPEAVEQETTTEENDDLEPTVAEASDVKDER